MEISGKCICTIGNTKRPPALGLNTNVTINWQEIGMELVNKQKHRKTKNTRND